MAKSSNTPLLLPSVLDRLLGTGAPLGAGAFKSRTQVVREITQAVRRDLQNLLNTRRRCEPLPSGLDELPRSLVNYGLPDLSEFNLDQDDERQRLRAVIEETIRAFEPRFKSVQVVFVEDPDPVPTPSAVSDRCPAAVAARSGAGCFRLATRADLVHC